MSRSLRLVQTGCSYYGSACLLSSAPEVLDRHGIIADQQDQLFWYRRRADSAVVACAPHAAYGRYA